MNCPSCHHEHQGKSLAYICIGCPCQERPGATADGVPTSIEDRIPKWFLDTSDRLYDFEIKGVHWLTNGHVMLRLDGPSKKAYPFKGDLAPALITGEVILLGHTHAEPATPSFPFVPPTSHHDGSNLGDYVVLVGGRGFSFPYVAMVERLYPGCTWRAQGLGNPAHAMVGDEHVAAVMCLGSPDEVKAQRMAAENREESR